MLSIGQVSQRTGIKVPTIRYYEELGLVATPERSDGNQRRYDKLAVSRLNFIRHSRELGFSLGDIRELLRMSNHGDKPCNDIHSIADRHLAAVRAKISNLKRLEKELHRISGCHAGAVSGCAVLETLADHNHCMTDH